MLRTAYSYNVRSILPLLALLLVCACAGEQAPKPAPVPAKPIAGAERLYAQNLSLARLSFIRDAGNLQAALPYINKMNAYALTPHANKVPFTIVQLLFTAKDTDTKYVAFAPIAPAGAERFEHLTQLLSALKPFNPEYYQVQLRSSAFDALKPISVWRTNADAAHTSVNHIYSGLNTNAKMLSDVENAKLKLELTKFFTEQRVRDAAYLSLESAKLLLARASQQKSNDTAEMKRLLAELTDMENTLNEKLPYKW